MSLQVAKIANRQFLSELEKLLLKKTEKRDDFIINDVWNIAGNTVYLESEDPEEVQKRHQAFLDKEVEYSTSFKNKFYGNLYEAFILGTEIHIFLYPLDSAEAPYEYYVSRKKGAVDD